MGQPMLRVRECEGRWLLAGIGASDFGLVNDFLSYLADRNYSPRTIRGLRVRSAGVRSVLNKELNKELLVEVSGHYSKRFPALKALVDAGAA